MMKDKGEDLDHFPVAALPLEKMLLQASEGLRQIDEGRAIAQVRRRATAGRLRERQASHGQSVALLAEGSAFKSR
jgi:hypothetical protein